MVSTNRRMMRPSSPAGSSAGALALVLAGMVLFGLSALLVGGKDLAGWAALFIVILMVLLIATRCPGARVPLYVGLALRAMLLVVGLYAMPLPSSGMDTEWFESTGWQISRDGFEDSLTYLGSGARTYCLIIGVFYSLAGRCPMVLLAVNVLFGTLCILEAYRAAHLMWGPAAAKRAAWGMAIMPTPVLFSAVLLREAMVMYAAALGTRYVVQCLGQRSNPALVGAFAAFTLGGLIHAGLTLMVPILVVMAATNGLTLRRLSFQRTVSLTFLAGIGLAAMVALFQQGWGMDKFQRVLNEEETGPIIREATEGGANYIGRAADTPFEVARQTPVRFVLFLLAPLPWMVTETKHLMGLFDAAIYAYLLYGLYRNREAIRASASGRSIFVMFVVLAWVYAMGTSNFGTAIRHRVKPLPMLLLMAAGGAPRRRRNGYHEAGNGEQAEVNVGPRTGVGPPDAG